MSTKLMSSATCKCIICMLERDQLGAHFSGKRRAPVLPPFLPVFGNIHCAAQPSRRLNTKLYLDQAIIVWECYAVEWYAKKQNKQAKVQSLKLHNQLWNHSHHWMSFLFVHHKYQVWKWETATQGGRSWQAFSEPKKAFNTIVGQYLLIYDNRIQIYKINNHEHQFQKIAKMTESDILQNLQKMIWDNNFKICKKIIWTNNLQNWGV